MHCLKFVLSFSILLTQDLHNKIREALEGHSIGIGKNLVRNTVLVTVYLSTENQPTFIEQQLSKNTLAWCITV